MEHIITLKLDDKRMPYVEIDPPLGNVTRVELNQLVKIILPDVKQETK